jgi:RNA polymerase sigma-70 factor, ECF subfamily
VDRARREALQGDLARLADGDRDAFHPVFVCLWPVLRGFASRYLPAADAEDAAQEALLKVFARAAVFDARRDALRWTLGIAAYEIKTARRQRQRRREDGDPAADLGDGRAGPEALAIAKEREYAIALALLDPADAATLRAYAEDDPPPLKGATFRKRVQRALARLRLAWRIDHGRP